MTAGEARVFYLAVQLADQMAWTTRETWPHGPVLIPNHLAILFPLKRAVEAWRAATG